MAEEKLNIGNVEEVLIIALDPQGEAATAARISLMDNVIETAKSLDKDNVRVINAPDEISTAVIRCPEEVTGKLRQAFPGVTFAGEKAVDSLIQAVMKTKPSRPKNPRMG